MNDDRDAHIESTATAWAVFGDLMSVMLGAFVLILLAVIGMQIQLSSQLDSAIKQRQVETQRRETLEHALAGPLAAGRVTLNDGRIGISGNVLFALNSDQLQPEGLALLQSLASALGDYLRDRDEILMISGFTDALQVREGNRRFTDNWELSAQRALTVTRTLINAGIPSDALFAAAFGAEQPIASNSDAAGQAKNRRVEIAPIPRVRGTGDLADATHG